MMTISDLQIWVEQNPTLAIIAIIGLSIFGYFIARFIIARGLIYLAKRTETQYDDIIVNSLKPFRVAWLAPLVLIYIFSSYIPGSQLLIDNIALFFILWVSIVTLNALLNAMNQIYESTPNYTGVSIQGYLDIVKLLIILIGFILSISIFTGESPIVYLTGLGALTAVLLLVFRDTILSIVASIQISAQDLVKEGDWIEVPSYGADGDVLNMNLHTIKVQNWDKTITIIPTYKMTDVAYKNWRGMQESGGRRIKRSITVDMASIKFCDQEMRERFRKIGLLPGHLDTRLSEIDRYHENNATTIDSPLDGPQITNIEVFRAYMRAYIQNRTDIYTEGMTFLVRPLAPSREGLPIEVYAFTKTTDWLTYESIQAEIFDHFLAAAPNFDLRVFQEPTGMDFASFAKSV